MTKEQIAKLAKESGFTDADENSVWITDGFWTLELERFFHAAYAAGATAEREACAKVCDDLAKEDHLSNYFAVAALALRERSKK